MMTSKGGTLVRAYAPAHITGFFYTPYDIDISDYLNAGSCGAGFCLEKGVTSEVSFQTTAQEATVVRINGIHTKNAVVSLQVIETFHRETGIDKGHSYDIAHTIAVPLGSGFGTSGAGALSLALALNRLHNSPLTNTEAAGIAHEAEIVCRTGLGTVTAEFAGGMEIRRTAGAPGIASLDFIPCPPDAFAVILIEGPLSTQTLLKKDHQRKIINTEGRKLLPVLIKKPSIDVFLESSRSFSRKTGLLSSKNAQIIHHCETNDITVSMLMFGDGVFTIARKKNIGAISDTFARLSNSGRIIVSPLTKKGGFVYDGT